MTPLKIKSYLLGAIFRPFLRVLGAKKPKRAFFLRHPVCRKPPRMATKQQHEQTMLLERTIRLCIPSAEKPGATTPTLQDAFEKVWEAAKEAGEAPLSAVRLMEATRRRSDKSSSGSKTKSSSAFDTDESTAAHDTSAKGKYHHHGLL